MRRILGIVVALTALAVPAVAGASSSLRSLEGSWAGTGHTRAGSESGPLPVSFAVRSGKVSKLTLGPAKVACRVREEGGPAAFFATMPKLQGFPTVQIRAQLKEYVPLFLGSKPGSYVISHEAFISPSTPLVVQVDGFFLGNKFKGVGASTIEVTYAANEHGAFEANGAYSCNGAWAGTLAARR